MKNLHLTKGEIAMLIAALAYIVFPVDFIPELLAGPLGLTDDVAAVALIAATLSRARSRPVVVAGDTTGPGAGRPDAAAAPAVDQR